MGQTFAEKILSKKAGRTVVPGEIVEVEPDVAMSHDNTAAISGIFRKIGVEKIARPDIHVVILDTESVGGSFVKMQLGYCRAIAEHAGGRYFPVDHLSSGEVHDIITHEKEILADMCSIGQHSAVRTK